MNEKRTRKLIKLTLDWYFKDVSERFIEIKTNTSETTNVFCGMRNADYYFGASSPEEFIRESSQDFLTEKILKLENQLFKLKEKQT